MLVFKECLKLRGGVLLFAVGCLLLCDRYIWLYWFSTLLVVHAFCTAPDCGFLAVNWAVWVIMKENFPFSYFLVISLLPGVLCFVDVLHLGLYEIKLQKPGGPVHQGNLAVYLFIFHSLNLRAGLASLGSRWRIRCH